MRTIDELNQQPMASLRFRDFAELKSGRDQWSKYSLPNLQAGLRPEILETVQSAFPEPESQTKCLRWLMRGLELEKAIRKVKTDLEIGTGAVQKATDKSKTPIGYAASFRAVVNQEPPF